MNRFGYNDMALICEKCGSVVNQDDLFCNNCGSQLGQSKTWVGAGTPLKGSEIRTTTDQRTRTPTSPKRFYRSREDRWKAGVCGGLGEYFNIDPILIRIAFILVSFGYGIGIIAYIVLAFLVEENPNQVPKQYPRQSTREF